MLDPVLHAPHEGANQKQPDVRDIIDYAETVGELARIDGADWNVEIGVLAEIFAHSNPGKAPAVLFDNIKGYPPGMRIVSGLHNTCRRLAYAFGFPEADQPTELVRSYRDRMKNDFRLVPPVEVKAGPILENIDRDETVNLFKFPVPMIHEKDGGRYIGTYCVVIMRDPDTGWINLGTYRVVAHDKNSAGIWMSPGKHGRLIRDKYFSKKQPCPVLVCCGLDPVDAGRDRIHVDGRPLRPTRNLTYVLVNKPLGYVSTVSDPQHRPTVISLVRSLKERVYPVGRLDYHSSGIILLTNDGDLANFMMARASAVPRTYHVKLEESAEPEALRKLERGIVLDSQRTAPARIRLLGARSERDKPWYEITLVEGRYHQVRRMFERIGRPVVKLKRVRIAFLTDEGLAPGHFRHLEPREVERLKKLSAQRPGKTHAAPAALKPVGRAGRSRV